MKKHLLITFLVIIFGFTTYAQPGTIDLTFNTTNVVLGDDGANGTVRTTSIQSDGKIIIGGSFSSYSGIAQSRIARLNTDGTLDTSFVNFSGANGTVYSTSIQSDGKIIIGGSFTSYNGIARNNIARLNTNGTLDTTFAITEADGAVLTTSIQNDGKIIIGGQFTFGGFRNRITRLNTDGTLDTTFNPGTGANNSIQTISIQSDGKIIIGGSFTEYAGFTRSRIARLNTNGTLDTSFTGAANDNVSTTSIQSDGKIIIGGFFTSYNGIARNYFARLNTNGTLDTSFANGTGANNVVFTTSIQSDGKIIFGGFFTSYNNSMINYIGRLNTDGTLDSTFIIGTATNSSVLTTSIQSDGKLIIGGNFTSYSGITRNRIARLNTDGTVDTSFINSTGANDTVRTTSIQNDGKIIIGGQFTSYSGIAINRIARLNTDGTLDTSFTIGTGANDRDESVITTSIQSDGKIIIGGNFDSYNSIWINRIARLTIDGTLDTSFNPGTGANTVIRTTSIQSDGKIIIGGDFFLYNGIARNRIARLNMDGTLDTSFNPGTGANTVIRTTSIQSDGKIIIGGDFTSYNGIARNRIARLNTDGTIDNAFNPGTGANNVIFTTFVQSDGKIIIGGLFTSYNGIPRNYIARLNIDGTLDNSFNPGTSANGPIATTSIQSDGKIIIGGYFSSINGISRNNIARLNTDGTIDNTFNPGIGANNIVWNTSLQSDGKIIIAGDFTAYNGVGRNRIARINGDNSLNSTGFEKGVLKLYPNPSNGIFTLQTNEMNDAKSISIYTLLGQKIQDVVISSNETTIDISNQPKGVYIYKVCGLEGETKSGKLVIE